MQGRLGIRTTHDATPTPLNGNSPREVGASGIVLAGQTYLRAGDSFYFLLSFPPNCVAGSCKSGVVAGFLYHGVKSGFANEDIVRGLTD